MGRAGHPEGELRDGGVQMPQVGGQLDKSTEELEGSR